VAAADAFTTAENQATEQAAQIQNMILQGYDAIVVNAASPTAIDGTRRRLESCPVQARTHPRLGEEAWQIADQFGWAKTCDAEYVALARLLGCRLVTPDARLRRSWEAILLERVTELPRDERS